MIVAFDASMLIYLFDPKAPAPVDPGTGSPVTHCQQRLLYLFDRLDRQKAKIIVPTPALAEVLVRAQQGAPERLREIKASRFFRIAAFDERAAIEFSASQAVKPPLSTPRAPGQRQKAKFDDQILAIAAVERATIIYSDDAGICASAGQRFQVSGIASLPLPPEDLQQQLPFAQSAAASAEPDVTAADD